MPVNSEFGQLRTPVSISKFVVGAELRLGFGLKLTAGPTAILDKYVLPQLIHPQFADPTPCSRTSHSPCSCSPNAHRIP